MNAAIRETIDVAKKHGLSVEHFPNGSQCRLLISGSRCQVMRCRAFSATSGGTLRTFIPLFVPRSTWAEFLILSVRADVNALSEKFYIVPRNRLKKRTMLSTSSSWLQGYANGWHFLASSRHRPGLTSKTSHLLNSIAELRDIPKPLASS